MIFARWSVAIFHLARLGKIIAARRKAEFITPIPKPKKRKATDKQKDLVFDEGKGLSNEAQQYAATSELINAVRDQVDRWRALPPSQ